MGKRNESAIVIGASLAGLLAARVLADHFEHVTILERDALPAGPEARRCVPQGLHAHGLLARGLDILAELFPGLRADLVAGGAIEDDISAMVWHAYGGWKRRFPTGIRGMFQSRPYLEWHVRRQVSAIPNVSLLEKISVVGLNLDAAGRVRGVHTTTAAGAAEFAAAMVVDCSGRGSRTPQLLESLALAKPRESEIHVDVAYATREYRRTAFTGFKAMLVTPMPPHERRIGVLFPMEGDRWVVTLGGWFGDHPPADEAGFLRFARELPVPHIHDHVVQCEPLSGIRTHRFPSSLRRHYESTRLPKGYVVLGDAVCSFNPVYGQGMTTAALEALELGAHLGEHGGQAALADFSHLLQKRIAVVVERAWMTSAGEDFRYPEARGVRPPMIGAVNAFIGQIHRQGVHDEKLALAFYRVMHMLDRPESLFHPSLLLRVLTGLFRPATDEGDQVPLAGLA